VGRTKNPSVSSSAACRGLDGYSKQAIVSSGRIWCVGVLESAAADKYLGSFSVRRYGGLFSQLVMMPIYLGNILRKMGSLNSPFLPSVGVSEVPYSEAPLTSHPPTKIFVP
jgi:hypothetical protein